MTRSRRLGETSIFLVCATYVFERPGGVDQWLDLALAPQSEHALNGAAHVLGTAVLEQQVPQVQTREAFVLIEELDWGDLVYLPPLFWAGKNIHVFE